MEGFASVFFGLTALLGVVICYCLYVIAPYWKLPACYTFYLKIGFNWIMKKQSVQIHILKMAHELNKQYEKDGLCVLLAPYPTVVIFDAKAMKTLLNEPTAIDKATQYSIFKITIGDSILVRNGQCWINRKKIMKPAFRQVELKLKGSSFSCFNKYSRKLVETLRNLENNTTDDENNILRIFQDSTLRSFFESVLELEENKSLNRYFLLGLAENFKKFKQIPIQRILKPWLYQDFCLRIFPEGKKLLKAVKKVDDIIKMVLESIKETMIASKSNTVEMEDVIPSSFGEVLLEAHLKNPSLTMEDLVKEMSFIIAAGYETTALTCMWCLYLLGLHEAVQESLYKELESISENINYEDLRNMQYLECIIKETLRLYTTIPIIGRSLNKEIQCGQYKIPKGSTVVLPLMVLHKNPDLYPDPEKFDPERFRPKKGGSSESLYSAPFAEGLRPCPGKVYAMNQLKVMIAHVIRNFKVISLEEREVELSWEMLLVPAKSPHMQFIPRNNFV